MNIEEIKLKISPILARYGVKKAAVFGSVVRGEAGPDSDVDILIELEEPLGLFKLARLNYTLEDALGKKVDLVKNTAIKPSFKDNILKTAIPSMVNKDVAYIEDILENIQNMENFLCGVNKEDFLADLEKQFAVSRVLEIIGEASAKLSEDFLAGHSEIDWRGLKSMRNLLIHEYAYVDAEEVWKACQEDVPDLKDKLLKRVK